MTDIWERLPIDNPNPWIDIAYIAAAAFFIISIIGLGRQATAKAANFSGLLGMMICCVCLYVYECYKYKMDVWKAVQVLDFGDLTSKGWYIIPIFFCVGAIIGVIIAASVQMTAMPLMVGVLNALGGLAASLSGIAYYVSQFAYNYAPSKSESRIQMFFLLLSIVVGNVTFVGSVLAAIKVNSNTTVNIPFIVNFLILFIIVALMILTGLGGYPVVNELYGSGGDPDLLPSIKGLRDKAASWTDFALLLFFSLIYGVTFVIPIGGADMPVVIALLNAFSGMSGCFAGFLARNKLLIITGSIVASSGCILSYIMCKAMNRSLLNVLIGGFGNSTDKTTVEHGESHPIETQELYNLLYQSKNILIVPGYGMASARAQGEVSSLVDHLIKARKNIKFGIHPVAGRLPGHMNVLLAEAQVPYDIVYTMDEINPEMKNIDICLVIGANDTVNPDAVNNSKCSIYGMPVIHAWESKTVVILKRNLDGAGYSAVFNPLPYNKNTRFYKGNANETLNKLNQTISQNNAEFYNSESGSAQQIKQTVTKIVDYNALPKHKLIGVLRESGLLQEKRVALSPESCGKLRELGFGIIIESKAGILSNYSNAMYKKYGCMIGKSRQEIFRADIIVKINEPTDKEVQLLHNNHVLISYGDPDNRKDLLAAVSSRGATWIAMDKVPRTSFAQKFDSLSSSGKISGYRSVVESLYYYQGFMTQQITASGKYPQAKVFILGAGVAGLEAIGLFKMLGAEIYCFDVRPVCREQVESMGGKFVEFKLDATGSGGYARALTDSEILQEQKLIKDRAQLCDIVICTAAIPGRRAPVLLTREAVFGMKAGSVIVDMSARTGGNCEITRNGGVYITENGVLIDGLLNFPSMMPKISSEMYAGNIIELLTHMGKGQGFKVDLNDSTITQMLVCQNNEVKYKPPVQSGPAPQQQQQQKKQEVVPVKEESMVGLIVFSIILCILFIVLLVMTIFYFPRTYYELWMIFTLSCFIGYLSVWGVSPSLHTPLMSLTNAISGVVVLSAIPLIHEPEKSAPIWLGMISIFFAAINIGGGFYVTHRMLSMFILKKTTKKDLNKEVVVPKTSTNVVKPAQPEKQQQQQTKPVQNVQPVQQPRPTNIQPTSNVQPITQSTQPNQEKISTTPSNVPNPNVIPVNTTPSAPVVPAQTNLPPAVNTQPPRNSTPMVINSRPPTASNISLAPRQPRPTSTARPSTTVARAPAVARPTVVRAPTNSAAPGKPVARSQPPRSTVRARVVKK